MEASANTGLTVVCVNPASVQGPGRTSGTARLLIGYLNGKLPAAVDGPLNVIDIADCTRGHLLAEERGVAGGAVPAVRCLDDAAQRARAALPPHRARRSAAIPRPRGSRSAASACIEVVARIAAQADPLLPRDGPNA